MCVQNKQRPWILVHRKLYGDVVRTEYPSHSKASAALHWRLKVIRDNWLDEEAHIEPKY